MSAENGQPRPYGSAALRYLTHGWASPLPAGNAPRQKSPVPAGFTGRDGRLPDEDQIAKWVRVLPERNIGLRAPDGMVGLDVDAYKPGSVETMKAISEIHGPLPRTWVSTSKTDLSGIRWFRNPRGLEFDGVIKHPTDDSLTAGEVIQPHHRYGIVWPSIHPDGNPYCWLEQETETRHDDGTIPNVDGFPDIPDAWADHLAGDCSCFNFDWLKFKVEADGADPVAKCFEKWHSRLTSGGYSRHDAAVPGSRALEGFARQGWPGAREALDRFKATFIAEATSHRAGKTTRTAAQAEKEWQDMLTGAGKLPTSIPQWEDRSIPPPADNRPDPTPISQDEQTARLSKAIEVFTHRLYLPDTDHVLVVLGGVAANILDGDPFWLLLVGPASAGKTEVVQRLAGLPYIHPAPTITEPALLSGVAKRSTVAGATGGLLNQIGKFGIFLCKDFSGILSMHRDQRAGVLSALREIFDGEWTRPMGSDGGKILHWKGKAGFIGAVTPSVDRHTAVMGTLGERFTLYRLQDATSAKKAKRALSNFGDEAAMRRELSEAVEAALAGIGPATPGRLTPDEEDRLVSLAEFTVKARTPVERDGYSRTVSTMPEYEHSARLAKQLAQFRAGILAIGATDSDAWRIITKAACDSIPRIRWQILDTLRDENQPLKTSGLVEATGIPRKTLEEHGEDLALLQLINRTKDGKTDNAPWIYRLSEKVRREWPKEAGEKSQTPAVIATATSENSDSTPSSNTPNPLEYDFSRQLDTDPSQCSECGMTEARHGFACAQLPDPL